MKFESKHLRWAGRVNGLESFRTPTGRLIQVLLKNNETLEDAQKNAYKAWKAGGFQ